MHESLSLERFRAPWVRAMLPFRMPRTSAIAATAGEVTPPGNAANKARFRTPAAGRPAVPDDSRSRSLPDRGVATAAAGRVPRTAVADDALADRPFPVRDERGPVHDAAIRRRGGSLGRRPAVATPIDFCRHPGGTLRRQHKPDRYAARTNRKPPNVSGGRNARRRRESKTQSFQRDQCHGEQDHGAHDLAHGGESGRIAPAAVASGPALHHAGNQQSAPRAINAIPTGRASRASIRFARFPVVPAGRNRSMTQSIRSGIFHQGDAGARSGRGGRRGHRIDQERALGHHGAGQRPEREAPSSAGRPREPGVCAGRRPPRDLTPNHDRGGRPPGRFPRKAGSPRQFRACTPAANERSPGEPAGNAHRPHPARVAPRGPGPDRVCGAARNSSGSMPASASHRSGK